MSWPLRLVLGLSCLLFDIVDSSLQAGFYHGTNAQDYLNNMIRNGSNFDTIGFTTISLVCRLPTGSTGAGSPTVAMFKGSVPALNAGLNATKLQISSDEYGIYISNISSSAYGGLYTCRVNGIETARITLRIKPYVYMIPSEYIIPNGVGFPTSCHMFGYPSPTREWILPNTDSHVEVVPQFNFHPLKASLGCAAVNSVGRTTVISNYTRFDMFSITTPTAVRVLRNQDASVRFGVLGYPDLLFSWVEVHSDGTSSPVPTSKYTQNITTAGLRPPGGESVLTLSASETSENRTYRVTVRSRVPWDYTRDTQSPLVSIVTVQAVMPPSPMSLPDMVVPVTRGANIVCSSKGRPPPSIDVFRNGERLVAAGLERALQVVQNLVPPPAGPRITIQVYLTGSAAGISGLYHCVANNTVPPVQRSNAAEVLAFEPLQFTEQPRDTVAVQGTVTFLNCKLSGYPPPRISWYHNGTKLAATTAQLQLTLTSVSQSGRYHCTARSTSEYSNKIVGSLLVSRNATMTVRMIPIITNLSASPSSAVIIGGAVNISCSASAQPPPALSFVLRGNKVKASAIHRLIRVSPFTTILSILAAGADEQGVYTCNASNVAGYSTKVIDISVPRPPAFTSDLPGSHAVAAGRPLEVMCHVSGQPPPRIVWSVPPGSNAVQQGSNVRLDSATLSDRGNYTCSASNPEGTVQQSFELDLQAEPMIEVSPAMSYKQLTGRVSFVCGGTGNPKPAVQWMVGGMPAHGQHHIPVQTGDDQTISSNLTIYAVTMADYGSVTCTLSNVWGSDFANTTLLQLFAPSVAPTSVSAVNETESDGIRVVLTWTMGNQPANRAAAIYRVLVEDPSRKGNRDITTDTESVTLSNLRPLSTYTYRIRAENGAGSGEYTPAMTFVTADEFSAGQSSGKFYNETWFYGAVGGAGLALLILLIVCIRCKSRGKRSEGDIFDPDSQDTKVAARTGSNTMFMDSDFSNGRNNKDAVLYDAYSGGGSVHSSNTRHNGTMQTSQQQLDYRFSENSSAVTNFSAQPAHHPSRFHEHSAV